MHISIHGGCWCVVCYGCVVCVWPSSLSLYRTSGRKLVYRHLPTKEGANILKLCLPKVVCQGKFADVCLCSRHVNDILCSLAPNVGHPSCFLKHIPIPRYYTSFGCSRMTCLDSQSTPHPTAKTIGVSSNMRCCSLLVIRMIGVPHLNMLGSLPQSRNWHHT